MINCKTNRVTFELARKERSLKENLARFPLKMSKTWMSLSYSSKPVSSLNSNVQRSWTMKKKRVRRWCFLYRNVPSLLCRGLGRGEMESAPIFLFLSFFVSFLLFFLFFFFFFLITAIFYEYSVGASAKERVASLLSLPASQTLLKFCIEDYTNGLDECVGRL